MIPIPQINDFVASGRNMKEKNKNRGRKICELLRIKMNYFTFSNFLFFRVFIFCVLCVFCGQLFSLFTTLICGNRQPGKL